MSKIVARPVLFGLLLCVVPCIASAGSLEIWGYDGNGEASGKPSGNDFLKIAFGGYHGLALKTDGSIVGWGRNTDHPDNKWVGQAVAPIGNDFRDIAGGGFHSLALKKDGTMVGWGGNDHGESTPRPGNNWKAIAGGIRYSLALTTDGTIVAWGNDDSGLVVPNTPTGSGFTAIAAGQWHALALRSDGSIEAWGSDADRNLSDKPTETGFIKIATHLRHSYALRADGSIVAWGRDAYGQRSQTPIEGGFKDIDAGDESGHALRADGSIKSWGCDEWKQVQDTPLESGFSQIASGAATVLVLRVQNSPPEANAGPDQTVECTCQQGGTYVTLNGTGSSDPDGDPLTYLWTGQGFEPNPASGPNPIIKLLNCQGVYAIGLVVSDGKADSAPDDIVITVRDTTPPSLTCPEDITVVAAGPDGVSASDPAIVAFLQGASATDNCDPAPTISNDAPADFFPLGNTPVKFTAIDATENASSLAATVTVTLPRVVVYLEDDLGLPLDGQSIKVQPAYGGSWGPVFAGVTEGDGGFRCEMTPGYTKIRMTFNQASVEQTVAELAASGYTWTAVAATVKVIDHQGQGIVGVKVSQGGSVWVDHGYTDSAGELGLHLFPNKSYKFKVSGSAVSNSSQIAWFPVPGPIQFQAGYVVSAGTAIRGSIGGAWVSYVSPGMHILPGTYSFVFSSPTPSPQSVVVTAGVPTPIP